MSIYLSAWIPLKSLISLHDCIWHDRSSIVSGLGSIVLFVCILWLQPIMWGVRKSFVMTPIYKFWLPIEVFLTTMRLSLSSLPKGRTVGHFGLKMPWNEALGSFAVFSINGPSSTQITQLYSSITVALYILWITEYLFIYICSFTTTYIHWRLQRIRN